MPELFGIKVPWTIAAYYGEHPPNADDDTQQLLPRLPSTELSDIEQQTVETMSPDDPAQNPTIKVTSVGQASDTSTGPNKTEFNFSSRSRLPEPMPLTQSLLRPPMRRSISTSLLETPPRHRDSIHIRWVDELDELARPSRIRADTSGLKGLRNVTVHREIPRPVMITSTHSSPSLRVPGVQRWSNKEKPLKRCLKQKAHSTIPTPTNENGKGQVGFNEGNGLRRVKTDSFQILKPPVNASPSVPRLIQHTQSPTRVWEFTARKGDPTSPTVTRTDVHVIAISPYPSQGLKPRRFSEQIDPATPAPQQGRRHSHSCDTLGTSSPTKGLEHVNTKLSEWRSSWNGTPNPFNPEITVTPGEDRYRHWEPDFDEEEGKYIPPPNSMRTSAMPSRQQSCPPSSSLSRRSFEDVRTHNSDPDGLCRLEEDVTTTESFEFGKTARLPRDRDSITIARDQLAKSLGLSDGSWLHRDSIELAKERIQAKKRTTSGGHTLRTSNAAEGLRAQYEQDAERIEDTSQQT